MPKYVIEVYELHTSCFKVEASSKEEAIVKYQKGESDYQDGSIDYIQIADSYGSRLDEMGMDEEKLKSLDIFTFPKMFHGITEVEIKPILPGIRSVEEVE